MSDLDPLCRTALIPFWARVQDGFLETPILGDRAAVSLAPLVGKRFGTVQVNDSIRVGCCLRDRIFDEWIIELTRGGSRNNATTVIDIGVGLDTRLRRQPTLAQRYVEIDSKPIVHLRDEWLPGTRAVRVNADGMCIHEWIDAVDHKESSLTVLALGGVLTYQTPSRVSRFFVDVARLLPGAFVLFDSPSPLAAWPANRPAALAQGRPRYAWSPWSTKRIVTGSQRLLIIREKGFMDFPCELTRSFSMMNHLIHSIPPMRSSYRLTLAKLPG